MAAKFDQAVVTELPAHFGRDDLVGWTYFALALEVSRIKIGGCTCQPASRLGALMTGCPTELVGLGLIRDHRMESYLHDRFAALRWLPNREWFRAEPMLTGFIREIAMPFEAGAEIRDLKMSFAARKRLFAANAARINRWFLQWESAIPESEWVAWQPHAAEAGSHI